MDLEEEDNQAHIHRVKEISQRDPKAKVSSKDIYSAAASNPRFGKKTSPKQKKSSNKTANSSKDAPKRSQIPSLLNISDADSEIVNFGTSTLNEVSDQFSQMTGEEDPVASNGKQSSDDLDEYEFEGQKELMELTKLEDQADSPQKDSSKLKIEQNRMSLKDRLRSAIRLSTGAVAAEGIEVTSRRKKNSKKKDKFDGEDDDEVEKNVYEEAEIAGNPQWRRSFFTKLPRFSTNYRGALAAPPAKEIADEDDEDSLRELAAAKSDYLHKVYDEADYKRKPKRGALWYCSGTVCCVLVVMAVVAAVYYGAPTLIGGKTDGNRPVVAPTLAPSVFVNVTETPTLFVPTAAPVEESTASPIPVVTQSPTIKTTHAPTKSPTKAPSKAPTKAPSKKPTQSPTDHPLVVGTPTSSPSTPFPTTTGPTQFPSVAPSSFPTAPTTSSPTLFPTTSAPTPFPSV